MPHEISDGTDQVLITTNHALTGIGNWHRKGTEYRDCLPRLDWLQALGLADGPHGVEPAGWHIAAQELVPVAAALDAIGPIGGTLQIPNGVLAIPKACILEGWKALACSETPLDIMDIVPSSYTVIQNSTLADLADVFTEAGRVERGLDIPILSAGTLRSRRLAFVSLGVPDDDSLDGLPARGHSLNLATSHDRSAPLLATLSQRIVVCGNTFRSNVLGRQAEVSIRHTVGAEVRLVEARGILRDMIGAATDVDRQIRQLIDTELSLPRFRDAALPAILGDKPDEEGRGLTLWDNRRDAILDEYLSDHVPPEYRGTAWAGLMATQGWEQHSRTQRGGRHRAAVAIEKTLVSRAANGYPATRTYLQWLQEENTPPVTVAIA